jgi:hypothetical protein
MFFIDHDLIAFLNTRKSLKKDRSKERPNLRFGSYQQRPHPCAERILLMLNVATPLTGWYAIVYLGFQNESGELIEFTG